MTVPKDTTAISIVFTGLIGVLYAASSTILLNQHQQEEKHTRQVVAEFQVYFTQTQDDFNYRFADWSEWDDTYTFVKDANEDYIEENLTPEALITLDVNLVYPASGRLVYGTGIDIIHQKNTLFQQRYKRTYLPKTCCSNIPTQKVAQRESLLPEAPTTSSRPILTNEGEGPIRGTLIFDAF